MSPRFLVVAGLLLLLGAPRCDGQDIPTLAVQANVVPLLVTVRDRDGHLVTNLKAEDFKLKEDGKTQTVRYFSRESDLPLTVGLLVDTSRSQRGVLAEESAASATFLDHTLRAQTAAHPVADTAFVVSFDTGVHTLQGVTDSREKLKAGLARLVIPAETATLIFSAVKYSAEVTLAGQTGRKAMILLTDGVEYRDPTSIGTAIEFAQRTDTMLYSILFSDEVQTIRPMRAMIQGAMKARGRKGLERMAVQTGATTFEVSESRTIEAVYGQIEEELRSQYSLGYTPTLHGHDGKFHAIQLTTKDKHLKVTTRAGYYAR